MERVQGPQTPFESYCPTCQVTFPVEARRCLHCGGHLVASGQRVAEDEESALLLPGAEAEDLGEDNASLAMRRFGGLLIWGLVALSALLSNLCQRG